jgi:hypothetical protein
MTLKNLVAVAVTTLACLGTAHGQSTLGEILDKGAKKLTYEDFVAMLPATSFAAWSWGGGESKVVYKADGTFSGNALHYPSRTTSPSYGTWKVDETGKFCVDEKLPAWNQSNQDCSFRFEVGGEQFDSPSDTDRSAKLIKRKITK